MYYFGIRGINNLNIGGLSYDRFNCLVYFDYLYRMLHIALVVAAYYDSGWDCVVYD